MRKVCELRPHLYPERVRDAEDADDRTQRGRNGLFLYAARLDDAAGRAEKQEGPARAAEGTYDGHDVFLYLPPVGSVCAD